MHPPNYGPSAAAARGTTYGGGLGTRVLSRDTRGGACVALSRRCAITESGAILVVPSLRRINRMNQNQSIALHLFVCQSRHRRHLSIAPTSRSTSPPMPSHPAASIYLIS
mmetsp:Transcript_36170/g.73507  ORF Transcript_36170/g.73507 Transcript_36170/m.73507 type:complete len:110 (+) Transcript_36170:471-800(+)